MVSFDVPPPPHSFQSRTPSSLKNNDDHHDHDEDPKQQQERYRVTPHPSKQTNERQQDNDSNMNEYVSNVPSPEQQEHAVGDEESEWSEWLESSISTQTSKNPNLQAYVAAKTARQEAQKALESALEACLDRMTHAMTEEILADSVGVVYQEQGERFETLESSIVNVIKANHVRRIQLNQTIENANTKWGRQYKRLRTSIWKEDVNEQDLQGLEQNVDPTSTPVDEKTTMEAQPCDDPNWTEIAQYGPARETTRSFLAAREKLRDADDALSQALDEIHSGLKADADAITQVVIEFCNQFESASLELEQDIQFHLMNNCQRRDAFQTSLQESAKQAQGLIANLLSRLTSGL